MVEREDLKMNINALHGIIAELENGAPISKALSTYYTKRKVIIPIKKITHDRSIDELFLTTRTSNALKRAKLMTFGDLLDYVENGNQLKKIRGFGVTSIQEFYEQILDYHFELLNADEKVEFLITFVEGNEKFLKEAI